MYAVGLLSRFMHCCNIPHFNIAKRVLRYIKGIANFGVWFMKANVLKLVGYSDSDWVGSMDDMQSTSKYLFSLGSGVTESQLADILTKPLEKARFEKLRNEIAVCNMKAKKLAHMANKQGANRSSSSAANYGASN
ncbi:hypothetical protein EPI10_028422 [Gossypium australe]|uniref:Retrovirus-related Pol polyprotein from transposon TNT 1-94 n=1 Tax=Gossypium australe TaxID=47621 RepID=A0A5B6UYB2_9ROSI|nr:hypothetical protein EPI10_028422 [Gossypium australe]